MEQKTMYVSKKDPIFLKAKSVTGFIDWLKKKRSVAYNNLLNGKFTQKTLTKYLKEFEPYSDLLKAENENSILKSEINRLEKANKKIKESVNTKNDRIINLESQIKHLDIELSKENKSDETVDTLAFTEEIAALKDIIIGLEQSNKEYIEEHLRLKAENTALSSKNNSISKSSANKTYQLKQFEETIKTKNDELDEAKNQFREAEKALKEEEISHEKNLDEEKARHEDTKQKLNESKQIIGRLENISIIDVLTGITDRTRSINNIDKKLEEFMVSQQNEIKKIARQIMRYSHETAQDARIIMPNQPANISQNVISFEDRMKDKFGDDLELIKGIRLILIINHKGTLERDLSSVGISVELLIPDSKTPTKIKSATKTTNYQKFVASTTDVGHECYYSAVPKNNQDPRRFLISPSDSPENIIKRMIKVQKQ